MRKYDEIIEQVSSETGVDANLIKAIMLAESSGNPLATSKAGAKGLMQVMPQTKNTLLNWYSTELSDIKGDNWQTDPEKNIRVGAYYLKKLTERFGGDTDKVIAGYNTGHNRSYLTKSKNGKWKTNRKFTEGGQWSVKRYLEKVKANLPENFPPELPSMEPATPPEINRREATDIKRRNLQSILDNLKARPDADPQTVKNLEKIIQRYANFDLPGQDAFPRDQPMDYVPTTARDREFDLPNLQTGPQDDRPLPPRYYDEGQRVTAPDRRSTVDPSKLRERDLAVRNWQEPATWSYPLTSPEQQAGMPDYFKGQQPQGLQGPSETYADTPYTKGLQGPSETYADKPYTQGLQGPSETYADIPYTQGLQGPSETYADTTPTDSMLGPSDTYAKTPELAPPGQTDIPPGLEIPPANYGGYTSNIDKFMEGYNPGDITKAASTAPTQDLATAPAQTGGEGAQSFIQNAAATLGVGAVAGAFARRGQDTGKKHVDFSSVTGSDKPEEQSWLRKAWEAGEKYLEPVAEYGKYVPIPYVQQGLTAIDALYDAEDAVTAANRGDYVGAVMEGAGAVGSAKDFQALQQGGGPNPLSGYNVFGDQAGSSELHKGLGTTAAKVATDVAGKALTGGYGGGSGGGKGGSSFMGQADSAAARYQQQAQRASQDYQRLTGGRLSAQGIQGPTREGIIGRQAANLTAATQANVSDIYSQAAYREQAANMMRDQQEKRNWMAVLNNLSQLYAIKTLGDNREPIENEFPDLLEQIKGVGNTGEGNG